MPYGYIYQCPECAFDVEIVGAREFTLSADGKREDYHYPAKDLYEWPVRKVVGLWSHLWCPSCRATRPHVLLELEEPTENPAHAFFAAEARRMTGAEVGPCPECGTTLTFDIEEAPCPQCDRGRLMLLGEYEP